MASVRDQNGRDTGLGSRPPPSARPVSRRSRSASASGRSRRQCQNKERHQARGESCERDSSVERDGTTRLNGHAGVRLDLNCIPCIRFLAPRSSGPARSLSSPSGDKMGDSPGGGSSSPSSASSTMSSTGSSSLIGAPSADNVMKKMEAFRHECKLNDLILQFSTGEIHCHRLVMAASSLYFRGMLCSNSGRISRREIIQMQGVDLSTMEYIVDFAYTGTISGVTRDRVRKLKELASVFRYPEIGEACRQYLGRSLRENRNRSRTPTRTNTPVTTPIKQIFYPGSGRSSSAGSGFSGGSEGGSELYSPPPSKDPSPLIEVPRRRGHESLRVEIPKRVPESPLSDHIETSPSPSPRANGTRELLQTIANLTQELDRKHPSQDSGHSGGMAFLPERLTTIPRRTSGGSSTGSSAEMASNASLDLFSMSDPTFALRMLREFNKIRKEGQLVDCVLRTATRDFPCHRVILQAQSTPLGAICQRELDGSKTMDVFVKRINPDTLQKVISYFYTGKIAISQRDVKSVYKASKRFGLDAVREACMVLDETVDRGNVSTDDSGISAPSTPNYTLDSPGI